MFSSGLLAMDAAHLYSRYQELQAYVGWGDEDAARVKAISSLLENELSALIDAFERVILISL